MEKKIISAISMEEMEMVKAGTAAITSSKQCFSEAGHGFALQCCTNSGLDDKGQSKPISNNPKPSDQE